MGIIVKPNTFTALATKTGEAAQVNANYDAIYSEFNGNISDANIAALANIQQSKILNLVADLATITARKGWVLIDTQTASISPSLDFITGIDATYDEYRIGLVDIVPATDGVFLHLRVSQAGVFQTGASAYQWARFGMVTSDVAVGADSDPSDSQIDIAANLGAAANESLNGEIRFWNPTGTTRAKDFEFDCTWLAATGLVARGTGSGSASGLAGAIDGIRLFMSAGNITSGTARLYGLRK